MNFDTNSLTVKIGALLAALGLGIGAASLAHLVKGMDRFCSVSFGAGKVMDSIEKIKYNCDIIKNSDDYKNVKKLHDNAVAEGATQQAKDAYNEEAKKKYEALNAQVTKFEEMINKATPAAQAQQA